jgi:glycosyltransferase involved in cell wall biosynthesis
MAESFPRVSIIIPTRNRADLLRQALASCVLQTWPEWEVIVVDDGSEEDIAAVVAEAQAEHGAATRRFVCVRQEKKNGNAARNNGLRHAAGEFIQYLDSDDLLHPEKLARQVRYLEQHPDLDATIMLAEFFYEIPGDSRILWNMPSRADMEDDLDRFLIEDAVWSPGGPLWRKAAVARIGGWDERLTCWQDWEFHVKALCAGITYRHENGVGYYHRDHQGPRVSVGSMTVEKARTCFLAGKLAYGYLKASPCYAKSRYLLMEYFFLNLERLEKLQAPGRRRVRMDALWFMRRLACSTAQRAVLAVMALLAGLPLLDMACRLYVNKLRTRAAVVSIRNAVKGSFLPPPPPALIEAVAAVSAKQGGAGAACVPDCR